MAYRRILGTKKQYKGSHLKVDIDTTKYCNELSNALEAAFEELAEELLERVKRAVPVESGDLKNSITKVRFPSLVKDTIIGDWAIVASPKGGYAGRYHALVVELGGWSTIYGTYTKKKGNLKESPVFLMPSYYLRGPLKTMRRKIRSKIAAIFNNQIQG